MGMAGWGGGSRCIPVPNADLRGHHWGAMQRVSGRGQALHTSPWGVLEEEGGLRGLAWWGGEGWCISVPNAHRGGDVGGLMQRVCGGDKALGAGPREILEQEGGLWGLAWWGGGPRCIAVPNTHRWGELRRVVLGGLVLSN